MNKKNFTLLCLGLAGMMSLQAKDVILTQAGTLADMLTDEEKATLTELSVSGPVNGSDVLVIRQMAGYVDEDVAGVNGVLETLNLAGADIVAGGSSYYYDAAANVEYYTSDATVGTKMFTQCPSLKSVTLPSSVVELGSEVFSGSEALESVEGDALATIGEGLYKNCKALKKAYLPANLTEVPKETFYYCQALESFDLPSSVTLINSLAFRSCGAPEIGLPEGLVTIDSEAFYSASLETVNFPSTLKTIGKDAFFYCKSLTGFTLPDGIETIKENAFSSTGVKTVTIPSSVTYLGGAFGSCSSLQEAYLPEGLTTIPKAMFYNCPKLTTCEIPSTVTAIEEQGFYRCSKWAVDVLPEGLETLGEYCFAQTGLETLVMPNSVTSIGEEVASECDNLTTLKLSESLTEIPDNAFACSPLEGELVIPEGVTTVGGWAFQDNQATELTLPSTMEDLGFFAFGMGWEDSQLEALYCYAEVPPTTMNSFSGVDTDICVLYVPENALDAYASANEWANFINIQALPSTGVESVVTTEEGASQWYSITGSRIPAQSAGICIEKKADGSVRKVLKK